MRCILLDVEGTITSLSFVKNELFPYAREALPEFLKASGARPDVGMVLDRLRRELGMADLDAIGATLIRWIDEDRKHPDLKELQGLIWEDGYRTGTLRGHLYPDVIPFWERATRSGKLLVIYSSGSVRAQKLLLKYSVHGDVAHFIRHHFDTAVGAKTDGSSYSRIAAELALPPAEIRFFSDAVAELDAARDSGLHVCRLLRPGAPDENHAHREIRDFTEIETEVGW